MPSNHPSNHPELLLNMQSTHCDPSCHMLSWINLAFSKDYCVSYFTQLPNLFFFFAPFYAVFLLLLKFATTHQLFIYSIHSQLTYPNCCDEAFRRGHFNIACEVQGNLFLVCIASGASGYETQTKRPRECAEDLLFHSECHKRAGYLARHVKRKLCSRKRSSVMFSHSRAIQAMTRAVQHAGRSRRFR